MNAKHYTILPLKWEATKTAYSETYTARVPFGSYTVERNREDYEETKPWEGWKMKFCFDEYYDEGQEDAASLKDGKEKAWANWLGRITAALKAVRT